MFYFPEFLFYTYMCVRFHFFLMIFLCIILWELRSFQFQYYEMSYGLNVEMHKQTEICKRLDAIIRQVLPFLSAEVIFWKSIKILCTIFNFVIIRVAEISKLKYYCPVIAPNASCNGSWQGQTNYNGGTECSYAGECQITN